MTDKPQTAAEYLESLGKNLDDLEGLELLEYLHFTATPAPWVVGIEAIERTQCCSEECIHADVDGQDRHIMETVYVSNDALFVAELRNQYPAMAEELRRLRARVADFEAEWRHYSTDSTTTACGLSVGDKVMATIVEARVTCPKCDEFLEAEPEGK